MLADAASTGISWVDRSERCVKSGRGLRTNQIVQNLRTLDSVGGLHHDDFGFSTEAVHYPEALAVRRRQTLSRRLSVLSIANAARGVEQDIKGGGEALIALVKSH